MSSFDPGPMFDQLDQVNSRWGITALQFEYDNTTGNLKSNRSFLMTLRSGLNRILHWLKPDSEYWKKGDCWNYNDIETNQNSIKEVLKYIDNCAKHSDGRLSDAVKRHVAELSGDPIGAETTLEARIDRGSYISKGLIKDIKEAAQKAYAASQPPENTQCDEFTPLSQSQTKPNTSTQHGDSAKKSQNSSDHEPSGATTHTANRRRGTSDPGTKPPVGGSGSETNSSQGSGNSPDPTQDSTKAGQTGDETEQTTAATQQNEQQEETPPAQTSTSDSGDKAKTDETTNGTDAAATSHPTGNTGPHPNPSPPSDEHSTDGTGGTEEINKDGTTDGTAPATTNAPAGNTGLTPNTPSPDEQPADDAGDTAKSGQNTNPADTHNPSDDEESDGSLGGVTFVKQLSNDDVIVTHDTPDKPDGPSQPPRLPTASHINRAINTHQRSSDNTRIRDRLAKKSALESNNNLPNATSWSHSIKDLEFESVKTAAVDEATRQVGTLSKKDKKNLIKNLMKVHKNVISQTTLLTHDRRLIKLRSRIALCLENWLAKKRPASETQ